MVDASVHSVADEMAIRNLLADLAMAADEGTPETYGSLVAADATWRMASLPGALKSLPAKTGRADIRASLEERRAAKTGGPGSHTRHILHQSRIRLHGDTAEARAYFTYLVALDTQPKVQLFAVYQDSFVRETDGWKLRSRDIEPG